KQQNFLSTRRSTPNKLRSPVTLVNSPSRLLFLCALLMICSSSLIKAQRTLGVSWEIPESDSRAMEELNTFKELGISVLEMPAPPSGKLRDKIRAQNLNVWASLGIQYPTAHTFAKSDSAFTAKVMDRATEFLAAPPVRVLILFEHGALGNSQFEKAAASFFNELPNQSSAIQQAVTVSSIPPEPGGIVDFFIYDIRLRPDNIKSPGIPIHDSIGGYKYSPSDDIRYLLTPFRSVVKQLPQQSEKPLIVESDWLFSMLSRHPRFKTSLHSLTSDTSLAFPVPEESLPVQHSSPLPAIILLFVWGIL